MEILEQKTQSTWERQREQNNNLLQKIMNFNTMYIECAQRAFLYKSIQTERSNDAYFNAHKWAPALARKCIPSRNICPTTSQLMHWFGLTFTHPVYALIRAYPIGPNQSGSQLVQPIWPMLSLYLNNGKTREGALHISSLSFQKTYVLDLSENQ